MSSSKHLYTKILTLTFAIFASLLLASSTFTPNVAKAYTRGNADFGMAMGNMNSASSTNAQAYYADIANMGFRWVRFDFNWSNIQPTDGSSYNWSIYDNLIAIAQQNNLKVLGILDSTPSWAGKSGCSGNACAPTYNSQFATFAAATAAHYSTSVTNWEIWNEENNTAFPSATCYAALLKAAYPAMKAANPSATVIVGGLAPGGILNGQQIDVNTYVSQLYSAGAKNYFNAIGYHPYTYTVHPVSSTTWSAMTTMHLLMLTNGDSNKKIWITEFGVPTNGPSGSRYVTEDDQSQAATDVYNAVQTQSMFGPFFWYSYKDKGTDTSTVQNFFGLMHHDGSEKPAYSTWQHLLQ